MTPESALMAKIALLAGSLGYMCFRCNAGTFLSADGTRYVKGLPEGFSDMLILKPNGEACFIETKVKPRKPTKQQINFINTVRSYGFRAGVAYTVDEARRIMDGDKEKDLVGP